MDKDERNDFRQEPSQEEKRPLKGFRRKQFIRRLAGKSSQDDSQENLPPGEEDKRRRRRVKLATFGAAACTVLFLATAAEIARVPDTDSSGPSTAQVMSELSAAETASSTGWSDALETEAAVPQTELSEEQRQELIRQGQESMKDQIFGDGDESGISPYLTITGMTDKEKRDAGFMESDFLRQAGLFLKDRGISTKRIIVENQIDSSLPDAMAFQGRLEKQDSKSFRFILFPKMPGEYIFLIEEKETEVQPETLTTETSSGADSQNSGQPAQNAVQPQTQAQPQSQQETDSGYDATQMSISSVPEELLNYLDNRYVFQYSLYDYLFGKGKKDVNGAEVTDYSIDAGTRQATIRLKLDDGSALTAVYSKDSGKYSFS